MGPVTPDFTSVKRATLPVQVAQAIQSRIDSGDFQPEELLPSERALSEAFDVSRVAVREAIQLLQAKGFVEVRQGKGSYVVPAEIRNASSLQNWVSGREDPLQDMVELRRIVEPGIAELAAQRASAEDKEKLLNLAHALKDCDPSDASDIDAEFHREIARLTGNSLVGELLIASLERSEALRDRTLKDEARRRLAAAGHLKIAKAIANGKPDEARKAMLGHLSDAARSI